MFCIIHGLIEKCKKNNNKVLIRVIHISKFHDCFFSTFFFYSFKVYSAFSTFYCGFENYEGSMCNFQAETGSGYTSSSGYIWLRQSGRPSSQTGPNMDHTYETSSGMLLRKVYL